MKWLFKWTMGGLMDVFGGDGIQARILPLEGWQTDRKRAGGRGGFRK